MKIYLAHPFDSRFAMRKWELHVEVTYDIEIVNPFYDITREDVDIIDSGIAGRYEKLNPNEVVNRDLAAIDSCDEILAFVNGDLSYGTLMEIVYASLAGKTVNIVCTNGHEKHPWLQYHADNIYTSLDEYEQTL